MTSNCGSLIFKEFILIKYCYLNKREHGRIREATINVAFESLLEESPPLPIEARTVSNGPPDHRAILLLCMAVFKHESPNLEGLRAEDDSFAVFEQ